MSHLFVLNISKLLYLLGYWLLFWGFHNFKWSLCSLTYCFRTHLTGKVLPWSKIGLWAQALCKEKKSRWFYDGNRILFRAPIWKGTGIARLKMWCYQCKVIIFIYNTLRTCFNFKTWVYILLDCTCFLLKNQVKEEWLLLPGIITAFIIGDILRKEGYSSVLSIGNNLKYNNTSVETNACMNRATEVVWKSDVEKAVHVDGEICKRKRRNHGKSRRKQRRLWQWGQILHLVWQKSFPRSRLKSGGCKL